MVPNATRVTIRWTTDELADSKVEFGLTTAYTGTVSDANLKTKHNLIVTDLTPETTYHYRIVSADKDGNIASTLDGTFTTQVLAGLVSDDFNYCTIDDPRWGKWQFVNPKDDATFALNGETLTISVPGDEDHDIWTDNTPIIRAPHLLQDASNPDLLHVAFLSYPTLAIQQQGVLAIQDANNFIRANFQYQNGKLQFVAIRVRDGVARERLREDVPAGSSENRLHLALTRNVQNRWVFYVWRDGESPANFGGFEEAYTINQVGIYAGNAAGDDGVPPFDMEVDFFFNDAAPIDPEDGVAQNLPVSTNPAGKGSVTKSAACGNPVTLTATPISGWRFAGWSGAASGTENPKSVSFTFGDFVIANFEQEQYTLTINEVGEGGVNHAPVQAGYLYTDTVTLTATPEVGWSFAGWSGDLTGTQNPATLLMNGDKTVTATFIQDQYTLTLNVSDPLGGSIVPSPAKTTYVYGDQVTLVATPTPGWAFAGWSGDATGTTNPLQVTMVGNTSITAIFTKEQYTLSTVASGNGTVSRNPDKTVYDYGDQVTLDATTTEAGWVFDRWSGDLTGSVNPTTITMTGTKSITAVFTRTQHTVQTFVNSGGGQIVLTPQQDVYLYGDKVLVTAVPAEGSTLEGWSGDLSGRANPVEITIDGNKSIVATFIEAPFDLTTTVTGQGSIARSPDLQSFKAGDTVLLTAVPAAGWEFTGWSGAASGSENPIQITMDSDKTVSATFVPLAYTVNVVVAGTVSGTDAVSNTVTVSPNLNEYTFGDDVTLTPVAAPGWTFARWEGDLTGTENPGQLEVTGSMEVTAYFTPTLYTVNVSVGGQGDGGRIETYVNGVENSGPYTYGQQVTLKAVADPGYVFDSWLITEPQAAGTTADDELTITIPDNRNFQARFIQSLSGDTTQIFLPLITR